MKRFIIPFSIAFFFHVALVWGNFDFLKKTPDKSHGIQFMTMILAKKEAPQPVRKPVKKIVKKVNVRKKKSEKKILKKQLMPEQKTVKKVEEEKEVREEIKEEVEDTKGTVASVQKAAPLYNYNPDPDFPRKARKRGWQGIVELLVLVDKKGNVSSIKVYKSSGYKLLDRSAMRSVKDWRFSPGRRGDEVVESEVVVPVKFSLTG